MLHALHDTHDTLTYSWQSKKLKCTCGPSESEALIHCVIECDDVSIGSPKSLDSHTSLRLTQLLLGYHMDRYYRSTRSTLGQDTDRRLPFQDARGHVTFTWGRVQLAHLQLWRKDTQQARSFFGRQDSKLAVSLKLSG